MGVQMSTGLFSGINTDELIGKLMEAEKKPVEKMIAHKNFLKSKISSYGSLLNTMATLKKSMGSLKGGSLLTAASSNEGAVKATATNDAEAGSHTVKVISTAISHSLVSGIFTAPGAAVADGNSAQRLRIQVGSGNVLDIKVDAKNNSLKGISEEINKGGIGVKASIVNVGDVYTINGSNKDMDFSMGERSYTASLKEGSYTGDELAAELQRAMNEAVSEDNGLEKPKRQDTFQTAYDGVSRRFKIYNNDDTDNAKLEFTEDSHIAALLGLDAKNENIIKKDGWGVMSDVPVKGIEGYRLVLTADAQGAMNTISIKVDKTGQGEYEAGGKDGENADNSGLSRLAFNQATGIANMKEAAEAKDAEIIFDGYKVTRNSNKIENLIPGVTLNLTGVTPNDPVNINISKDTNKIKESLTQFAQSYNIVMALATELSIPPDPHERVVLGDESTVRMIMMHLRNVMTNTFEGSSLGSIGIHHQKNAEFSAQGNEKKNEVDEHGREKPRQLDMSRLKFVLALDDKSFEKAVEADPKKVAKMFEGMSKALGDVIDQYSQQRIPSRKEGINKEVTQIDDKVERTAKHMTKEETQYRRRFSNLETTLGKLQKEGDAMQAALNGGGGGQGGKKK